MSDQWTANKYGRNYIALCKNTKLFANIHRKRDSRGNGWKVYSMLADGRRFETYYDSPVNAAMELFGEDAAKAVGEAKGDWES